MEMTKIRKIAFFYEKNLHVLIIFSIFAVFFAFDALTRT